MATRVGFFIDTKRFEQELKTAVEKQVMSKVRAYVIGVVGTAFRFISVDALNVGRSFWSPVRTGRFRFSFRIAINSIDSSSAPPAPGDALEYYPELDFRTMTLASMVAWKPGDTVFISNSVPYAKDIEYNKASLYKTPQGVMRVSVGAVVSYLKGSNYAVVANFARSVG